MAIEEMLGLLEEFFVKVQGQASPRTNSGMSNVLAVENDV